MSSLLPPEVPKDMPVVNVRVVISPEVIEMEVRGEVVTMPVVAGEVVTGEVVISPDVIELEVRGEVVTSPLVNGEVVSCDEVNGEVVT